MKLEWTQSGSVVRTMCVGTAFSLVTVVRDLKQIRRRLAVYIQIRLDLVSAMFNMLQNLFHSLHLEADPYKLSIAEFSL